MSRRLIGLAAGLTTAGVSAAAVVAERIAVGRMRRRPDPEDGEPFGRLRGEPLSVAAGDGVRLHVELDGVADAPLTIVFCHGYTLNQDCWHYQRRDLAGSARLVFYDHRGHGRSGRGSPESATLEQLAADLRAVIEAVAGDGGPVVLVGHSMGGMTIMALADAYPGLFGLDRPGGRIAGVALVATSAGRLAEVTFGLPAIAGRIARWGAPGLVRRLGRRPALVARGRSAGADLIFLGTRFMGFGDRYVSPAVVDFLDSMVQATPLDVVADFYPALMSHDKLAALPILDRVPTLILVGEKDRMTPCEHSAAMAAAVPTADLVVVAGAGHAVMLECPDAVTDALRTLVARVSPDASGGASREDSVA